MSIFGNSIEQNALSGFVQLLLIDRKMELKNVPKVGLELNLATKLILGTFATACIALLFLGIMNLTSTEKTLASGTGSVYYLAGNSITAFNRAIYDNVQSGDTLFIKDTTWQITKDLDLSATDLVIIVDGGTILFDKAYTLALSANTQLLNWNGGELVARPSKESSDMEILFGGTKVFSWDGTGALHSFADFNGSYGYNGSMITLPVSLISFQADLVGEQTRVIWSTAQEDNNSHFEVQRSLDGQNYEVIQLVDGMGNSTERTDYEYVDAMLPAGAQTIYYQLKQVDFDGKSETFPPVAVRLNTISKGKVFPNPASDHVSVSKPSSEAFLATLIDQTGAMIATENSVNGTTSFDTKSLPNGIYFVSIETDGQQVESHRVVVKH